MGNVVPKRAPTDSKVWTQWTTWYDTDTSCPALRIDSQVTTRMTCLEDHRRVVVPFYFSSDETRDEQAPRWWDLDECADRELRALCLVAQVRSLRSAPEEVTMMQPDFDDDFSFRADEQAS